MRTTVTEEKEKKESKKKYGKREKIEIQKEKRESMRILAKA